MVKKLDGSSSFAAPGALDRANGPGASSAGKRPSASARPRGGPLSGLAPRGAPSGEGGTKGGFSVKPRLKIADLQARNRNREQPSVGGQDKAPHEALTREAAKTGDSGAAAPSPVSERTGGGNDSLHDAARQATRDTGDTIAMMQKLADENAKATFATALEKHKTDLASALAELIKSTGSNIRNVAQG